MIDECGELCRPLGLYHILDWKLAERGRVCRRPKVACLLRIAFHLMDDRSANQSEDLVIPTEY